MKSEREILKMIGEARETLRDAITAEAQAWSRYQTEAKALRAEVNLCESSLAGLISAATARPE